MQFVGKWVSDRGAGKTGYYIKIRRRLTRQIRTLFVKKGFHETDLNQVEDISPARFFASSDPQSQQLI